MDDGSWTVATHYAPHVRLNFATYALGANNELRQRSSPNRISSTAHAILQYLPHDQYWPLRVGTGRLTSSLTYGYRIVWGRRLDRNMAICSRNAIKTPWQRALKIIKWLLWSSTISGFAIVVALTFTQQESCAIAKMTARCALYK